MICKVKEPIDPEYGLLRKDQLLFTYLHLAASRTCTEASAPRRHHLDRVRDGAGCGRLLASARADERSGGQDGTSRRHPTT